VPGIHARDSTDLPLAALVPGTINAVSWIELAPDHPHYRL